MTTLIRVTKMLYLVCGDLVPALIILTWWFDFIIYLRIFHWWSDFSTLPDYFSYDLILADYFSCDLIL